MLLLLLLHPLSKLVRVTQQFLFLFTQPLQLPEHLFALRFGLSQLERGLQLSDLVVDVFLSLSQLAQPIDHFTLRTRRFLSLFGLCLRLSLITILIVL